MEDDTSLKLMLVIHVFLEIYGVFGCTQIAIWCGAFFSVLTERKKKKKERAELASAGICMGNQFWL